MEKFYSNNSKKNLFINLFIVLILIISTLIYIIFVAGYNSEEGTQDIPTYDEIGNNVKEGPLNDGDAINNNKSGKGEFSFTFNKKINFKNSKSLGNIKIENPASNKYNFYVEIKLKDKDDIIYKSPILEPNQHIENDYLIAKLGKGVYNAVATIFVVNPETEEVVAKSNVDVEIKVNKN